MKLKHKEKLKMARKMRTPEETKKGVSIFLTKAWKRRRKMKQDSVIKDLK